MTCASTAATAALAAALLAACSSSPMPSGPEQDPRPAAAAAGPTPSTGTAASCASGLFTAADVAIDTRKDPALIRQRAVRIDFSKLDADRVVLNLFDHVCLTAIRDAAAPSADAWTGTIDSVPNSSITLITANRTVIGTIVSPPRTFQIRLLRDDVHLVNELDPSRYPKEKAP